MSKRPCGTGSIFRQRTSSFLLVPHYVAGRIVRNQKRDDCRRSQLSQRETGGL